MTKGKIRVFHLGEGKTQTTQTAGMLREEMVSSANYWVGFAKTAPKVISGWHHHGEFESFIYVVSGRIRMEFGKDGRENCEGAEGDLIFVPKNAIHRESNPGETEQLIYVVRIGKGTAVTNVEGPENK